jgi:hypothetical protein
MKSLLTLVATLCAASPLRAQGTVLFVNRWLSSLIAPVYYPDNSTWAPAGSVYVQLQAGPEPNSLAPVGTPVLLGPRNGFYDGGVVTVPTLPPGVPGWFQVLAWDIRAGGFDEAKTSGLLYGDTGVFPGSTSGPPPEFSLPLFALPSMILVPEPPSGVLLALGGVAWLALARAHGMSHRPVRARWRD